MIEHTDIDAMLAALMLGKAIDWPGDCDETFPERFIERAVHHGAAALVGFQLKQGGCGAGVPASVLEHFEMAVRKQVASEMLRSHDLKALVKGFGDSGVRVVVLKGAALAYSHYPESWMRPRVDTDLFIALADIEKTRQVFKNLDYLLIGRTYKSHQFNSIRRDSGGHTVNYDVHWRSSNLARFARVISHAEAWETGVKVKGLARARAMSPLLALLQACMHRAGNPEHDPNRLIWLYDIHLLLSGMTAHEQLEFARRAEHENLQAVCGVAIGAAREYFQTEVFPEVLDFLDAPPKQERSADSRFKHSALGLIFEDLRELPGWNGRTSLLREYLAPTPDYLRQRYGARGRLDLPWLYLKYYTKGFIDRVSLK